MPFWLRPSLSVLSPLFGSRTLSWTQPGAEAGTCSGRALPAGRAGEPGVGGEPSGLHVGALKTVFMLFVSSLFICCLLSCGASVKFLLKTPSFPSCAKTNKEKAWAPCPSWAAAPGGQAGGGWGPGRVSVELGLSHKALPPLPPPTMRRFKNEASQEACRFVPKRVPSPFHSTQQAPQLRPQPFWGSWATLRP